MAKLFEIRRIISPQLTFILPLIPLVLAAIFYLSLANARRIENPKDKLLPLPEDFIQAAKFVCTVDEFKGTIPIVEDLKSSLRLLILSFGSAVLFSLIVGLHLGSWPWARAMFNPFITLLSYLPPIALMPVIIIVLGIGDLAKSFLVFLAVSIPLIRGTILKIEAIPERKIWSALTLGASPWQMIWVVIRRTIEPGFLEDVRLLLGTAWVYLLAAELIASDTGLGYRISIAGRNLNIALIFFYVAIICVIAYAMDRSLYQFNRWKNHWALQK